MKQAKHIINIKWSYKTLVTLCFLVILGNSYSQFSLSVGSSYVRAFEERNMNIQGVDYTLNPTHGFQLTVRNSFEITDLPLFAHLYVGYRQLHFSGNSTTTSYRGYVRKFFTTGGVGYAFKDRLHVNALIEAENNLEFEEFNLGMGDLFRVSLALEGSYGISDRFNATLLFSRAMTPITPAYTVYNPQYQLRVGFNYRLL